MPVDRCCDCNATLGTETQAEMFTTEHRCPPCERQRMAKSYCALLPESSEMNWCALTEKEQGLVTSVRQRLTMQRPLSEPQFIWLEDIYRKRNV